MKDVARAVRDTVNEVLGLLSRMKPAEVSARSSPDKWCKKEILGHLIDSAANNHQRFVRAAYKAAADYPPYSQNDWVRIQGYAESDWSDMVTLWAAYNKHLSNVLERLPEDAYSAPVNIGKEEPATLEFVARDYVRHLRHHVDQLMQKGN